MENLKYIKKEEQKESSMQLVFRGVLVLLITFFFSIPPVYGQATKPNVLIAVHECEPFVIEDGTSEKGYTGLSIYLLEQMAQKKNFDYQLKGYSLSGMLDAVRNGEAFGAVSCISITSEREKDFDFTHSFFETHLAIATRQSGPLSYIIKIFTSKKFLKIMGGIFAISAVISIFLWLFEHKLNSKLYTAKHTSGKIIEAFIPGLLCITKGPPSYWMLHTIPSRLLAVIGSIGSTFIVAGITALVASALTTQQLSDRIRGPQDLHNVTVGALSNSTSSRYLDRIEVSYQGYESVETMLTDLEEKKIDAIVEDAPVLQYLLKKGHSENKFMKIDILPTVFEKQNYGMILPQEHRLRDGLNQALLEARQNPKWKAVQDKYLEQLE